MTLHNTFEGAPLGVRISSSNQNTEGTSGDALTVIRNGTGDIIATNSTPIEATKYAHITSPAGSDGGTYVLWNLATPVAAGLRAMVRFTKLPTANTPFMEIRRASSAKAVQLVLKSTGVVEVWGTAFLYSFPNPVVLGATYQFDVTVQPGASTTDGKITAAVYPEDGVGYALGTSAPYVTTTADAGTGTLARIVVGSAQTVTEGIGLDIDEILEEDTFGLIGPYTPPVPPEQAPVMIFGSDGQWWPLADPQYPIGSVTPPPSDHGALPLGDADYPIPAGAIFVAKTGDDTTGAGTEVSPYATIAKAVAMVTTSDKTIIIRGGTYEEGGTTDYSLGILVGQPRTTIQNYPGEAVWLDGTIAVTDTWVADGARWRLDNWTKRFPYDLSYTQGDDDGSGDLGDGFVRADYPAAHMPDSLYLDGVSQRQVTHLEDVTAGKFFLDTATSKVYAGTNPATATEVRMGWRNRAMTLASSCNGSIVRGIGFRRYSNPIPDQGMLLISRPDCVIENCYFEYAATTGVAISMGTRVGAITFRKNTVRHNGMMGLAVSTADGTLVEYNLITDNNVEVFDAAPASGGIKCTRSHDVIFRHNTVSANIECSGLWLDECVYNFQVYSNDLQDNTLSGLNVELSALGIVADNLITRNGGTQFWLTGSNEVRVWNNTIGENDFEGVVIMQDNRTPTNSSYAKDSRQPAEFYQTEMTWYIVEGQWCNNVTGKGRYATWRVKQHNYTNISPNLSSKGWAAFGITADGNLFNRYAGAYAQASAVATTWGTGTPGTETSWSTLAAWRTGSTAAGRSADANSVEISGTNALNADGTLTDAAKTATANAPRPLPTDIAALLGNPAPRVGVYR